MHLHFSGLVPGEDAPDIVANTFLHTVEDKQMTDINLAFMGSRLCA